MTDLPQRLMAWFAGHDQHLQSCGITGVIGRSPADWCKSSAWMTLEVGDHGAQLIVWISGEAELMYGNVATGVVRQEHRDLHTGQDLLDAIETICVWMRSKGAPTLDG
ncbi:hypothetical protein [Streptomyces sp. NPDC055189]